MFIFDVIKYTDMYGVYICIFGKSAWKFPRRATSFWPYNVKKWCQRRCGQSDVKGNQRLEGRLFGTEKWIDLDERKLRIITYL